MCEPLWFSTIVIHCKSPHCTGHATHTTGETGKVQISHYKCTRNGREQLSLAGRALGWCVVFPALWCAQQGSPGECLPAAETAASAPQPRRASWHQSALCRKTWPTNDHLISFSIQFGSGTWPLPSCTVPQAQAQAVPAQGCALGSAHAAAALAGCLLPGSHTEPLQREVMGCADGNPVPLCPSQRAPKAVQSRSRAVHWR